MAAASQLCVTVTKAINKLRQVLLSEISTLKNCHHGCESNDNEIEEFNKKLGSIALDLKGTFKWTKVELLNCFTTSEISIDRVHLNFAGLQNIVKSIRN